MHAQLEDLYSLKLPLGRNLAGAVWQAETLKGGKAAAVAVLDLEDLSDANVRKRAATRFRRDMGLLKRVNHPHVVRVLNVGRTRAGRPFAAMEHIDGESLNDWLQTPRSGADRIRVASALLDGLEAAHRAGVAHGDLEPGNVLMSDDGMPTLIGFGLNRTLARQSHPEWNEESGLAKTIAFRAPEEAHGMGGHSADVYATGILLHLICSGELPGYEGSTLRETASRLPAGLVAVIERALMEDPLERHPSMGAMRKAWLDATTVAKEAIEGAASGFRAESERPMRSLSAPPSVGVALAPEQEEEDEDEVETGRASLMPVGVALADDEDEDDLTKLPRESVNVLGAPPPPVAAREIAERFSDPPPDSDMRISLSDMIDGNPPPDPEMRISLSDVMEVNPAPAPPRPAPRRPSPAAVQAAPLTPAPSAKGGSSTALWAGLAVAAIVVGGGIWFSQSGSTETEAEVSNPPTNDEPEPEPRAEAVDPPAGETPPENTEPPPEVEPVFVALRLHGLPDGAVAEVDGVAATIDGDSISFPGDGEEHTIVVTADGYERWERSLATATPLDLLVVSEAIAPTPMDAPPIMRPDMVATPMRDVPMRTTPIMRTTMRSNTMGTMRPGLARDPGF